MKSFPGYAIDTDGNVWTCLKQKGNERCYFQSNKWRKLKVKYHKYGYPMVGLRKNKKTIQRTVHSLVLENFDRKMPRNMEACHNDGNPSNCKLSNLRWDTRSNNAIDALIHGTANIGKHGVKLDEFKVRRIRLMKAITPRLAMSKIAKLFDVDRSTIGYILNRKVWKHI